MGPLARSEPGGTLTHVRGVPYPLLPRSSAATARLAGIGAAIASFVLSLAAIAAVAQGSVAPGVDIDEDTGTIRSVLPSGYAWRGQVQAGDELVSIRPRDDPRGWAITVIGAGGIHTVAESQYQPTLQRSLPIAIGALVASLLGVALLRLGYRLSSLAFVGAILLATTPLGLSGQPSISTAALGLSALAPTAWIAGRPSLGRIIPFVILAAVVPFLVVWALARTVPWPATYEATESFRSALESGGIAIVAIGLVVLPLIRREFPTLSPGRIADLTGLAVLGGISIAIVLVLNVEPIAVAIVAIVVVAVFPRWQRVMTVVADRLLLSDLREQAAIEATEEERARLARDIHDVPLQQIAGVIRRLETAPGLHDAGDDLRAVAAQLREVATDLRPPVLDDLGLGAALSFLADRATTEETRVIARFDDATGVAEAERAPAGVELAVFRIAEEAVNNARLHADATEIAIEGELAPTRLRLRIRDNGVGLSQPAMAAAAGRGRLGLASVRRRAALIGASLDFSSKGGAVVEIRWPQ